jgi:thiol-disulfide isomerase/thioredoxin
MKSVLPVNIFPLNASASTLFFTLLLGCAPNGHSQSSTDEATSGHREQPAVGVGESAVVKVSIVELEELERKIQSMAGKLVLVDIWSTSCAPCMREFPHLVKLSRQYADRVVCISFNVDYIGIKSKPPESYQPKIEQFLQNQKATLINFISSTPDEEVLTKFGAESMPAILIYDTEGKLVRKLTDANTGEDGLTYEGDVIPEIERLLQAQP